MNAVFASNKPFISLQILKTTIKLPTPVTLYTAVLLAIAATSYSNSLLEKKSILRNVLIDTMASLIENLIQGIKLHDDDIRTQVMAAISESGIAKLLPRDETQHEVALLIERQAILRLLVDQNERELLQRLTAISTEYQVLGQALRRELAAIRVAPRHILNQKSSVPPGTSRHRKLIQIFVASPGDVEAERAILAQIIFDMNEPNGLADHYGYTLQLLDWRDVPPSAGRGQGVLFTYYPVETWDLLIGILWMRFGSPSSSRYESGTEEEFRTAYENWLQTGHPRIMFYRRTGTPSSLWMINTDQLARVNAFWQEFDAFGETPGLYQSYETTADFERRIRNDLTKLLPSLF